MDELHKVESEAANVDSAFKRWPLVYAAVVACATLTMLALYLFSRYFSA